MREELIIIRGGGDLATGVAQKFYRAGFKLVVLETEKPTAIRRSAALCEAVYAGRAGVEDMTGVRVAAFSELDACYGGGTIPVIVDPDGESISRLKPVAVIDAILAKRNLGTHRAMAKVTIGLGPGFFAGRDVSAVIETMRGHDLGRLILSGFAKPNTGVPGEVFGKSSERAIYAPDEGRITHIRGLGDVVEAGEPILKISGVPVTASFKGRLRGLIRDGLDVQKGIKLADIEPRLDVDWRTISDKARCVGGAALEAYFYLSGS